MADFFILCPHCYEIKNTVCTLLVVDVAPVLDTVLFGCVVGSNQVLVLGFGRTV